MQGLISLESSLRNNHWLITNILFFPQWLDNKLQPSWFDIQELKLPFKLTSLYSGSGNFSLIEPFSLINLFLLYLISSANTHDNAWSVLPTFFHQIKIQPSSNSLSWMCPRSVHPYFHLLCEAEDCLSIHLGFNKILPSSDSYCCLVLFKMNQLILVS